MAETRYEVGFASTDDAELDHETTLLEDEPRTMDEILAACVRYGVRARVKDEERMWTIVPEHERESSARQK